VEFPFHALPDSHWDETGGGPQGSRSLRCGHGDGGSLSLDDYQGDWAGVDWDGGQM